MPTLGDSFPPGFASDFAERSLKVGMVLRTFVEDTNPPKIKFFVVVGIRADAAMLAVAYVNSAINQSIFDTPEKQALHLPMKAADSNGIFTGDCFVDCSLVYEKPVAVLQQLVAADPQISRGELTKDQQREIKKRVASSRSTSIRVKKMYNLL